MRRTHVDFSTQNNESPVRSWVLLLFLLSSLHSVSSVPKAQHKDKKKIWTHQCISESFNPSLSLFLIFNFSLKPAPPDLLLLITELNQFMYMLVYRWNLHRWKLSILLIRLENARGMSRSLLVCWSDDCLYSQVCKDDTISICRTSTYISIWTEVCETGWLEIHGVHV